jgi:hypothetical protein
VVKLTVTTSWDDGQKSDVRIAEMLVKAGLRATFYVPIYFEGRPVAISSELKITASAGFEIGAHSVTHRKLCTATPSQLRAEVRDSKIALEQSLGRSVQMFCYPMGCYNTAVLREVQQAGYTGARTTRMLRLCIKDCFEMPTTVQAFPHPTRNYLKNVCKGHNFDALALLTRVTPGTSWVELGKKLFDLALVRGGVWHLYGHSWEIEQLNLWRDLQDLFSYIGRRREASYATNSEAICAWRNLRESGIEGRTCT